LRRLLTLPIGHPLVLAIALSVLLTWSGHTLWVDQLFVTFLHEACHGLAALLTGGRLVQFTISPDASGLALTQGGIRTIILMAGYVGSCVWGGALLLASAKRQHDGWIIAGLASFFMLFSLLFVRNVFGLMVGVSWGLALTAVGWFTTGYFRAFVLGFLAVRTSVNATSDLTTLLHLSTGSVVTDAQLMSQELTLGLVPPIVFAVAIAIVALLAFFGAAWLAFVPKRRLNRQL
jgi:hypothetical protein